MKAKIFLGEYAYLYRGNIDLRELNEYIKTLTSKAFLIKWKDHENDLITISKKSDLEYFYKQWAQNLTISNQSFRLYVFEMPHMIQNAQIGQFQSSTQIYSKMLSPSQKQSCIKFQQGINQFTFGFQKYETTKSQEYQKEQPSQPINLQSIQEVSGSSKNISNQNLDKTQNISQQTNQDIKKQRLAIDFNDIQGYDLSTQINMDMKQSINAKDYIEIKKPNDDDYDDDNNDNDDEFNNENNFIDANNLYCDYCSDKIQKIDQFTAIYACLVCEDFQVCKICFDQYLEQVHMHKLQEQFLQ